MKRRGRNILIIKMSSLGDVILASSSAKLIKELEPQSFIGWLCEERNVGVLEGNPFIDEIFIWDRTFKGFIKTLRKARRYEWDVALDLQGLFKSAIFCLLSGAKRRFGLKELEKGSHIFYTHLVPNFPFLHAMENYLLAVYLSLSTTRGQKVLQKAILRLKGNKLKPVIYLSEKERAKAEEILGGDYPFVVLCPGTTWLSKQWLPERWARVGDSLAGEGYKVIFLGAKKDSFLVRKIKESMREPSLDLTGRTSIRESAGILERADLVISVDSGAMHLATAVNSRVLALFGPTNPLKQGPYGVRHRVIYKKPKCSPCRVRDCSKRICMEWISADEVMGLAKEMIRERGELHS